MDKKRLFLWGLYDFANSIVMIAFFLYFSQWLVVDCGVPDFWFNLIFVVSSALLLLTAPVAASIADKQRLKLPGLRVTTLLSAVFFSVTGIIAVYAPALYILAAVTFTFANYFYLFSFIYYNSLMEDISTPDKHGRASGWGQFSNVLGQIAAIAIALPFVNGQITLAGAPGRAQAFLPATLAFVVLTLPMLFCFREKSKHVAVPINYLGEFKSVVNSLKSLILLPGLGLFFLVYFFSNDAIITFANNYPIYLQKVWGLSDTVKSILLLVILLAGAVGSPVAGFLTDKFGARRTFIWVLGAWALIFPAMALAPNFPFFVTVCVIAGFFPQRQLGCYARPCDSSDTFIYA